MKSSLLFTAKILRKLLVSGLWWLPLSQCISLLIPNLYCIMSFLAKCTAIPSLFIQVCSTVWFYLLVCRLGGVLVVLLLFVCLLYFVWLFIFIDLFCWLCAAQLWKDFCIFPVHWDWRALQHLNYVKWLVSMFCKQIDRIRKYHPEWGNSYPKGHAWNILTNK